MIRVFNHFVSTRLVLLTVLEAIVLYGSVRLGADLRLAEDDVEGEAITAVIFAFLMISTMIAVGLYQSRPEPIGIVLQRLIVAFLASAVGLSAAFYVWPEIHVSRGVMAWTGVLSIGGVLILRMLFFGLCNLDALKRRVLVVGSGQAADDLIQLLNDVGGRNLLVCAGIYPTQGESHAMASWRESDFSDFLQALQTCGADEVVVATRERRGGVLPLRQLLDCKIRGIRVLDSVAFCERELGMLRIDHLKASWLIFGEGFNRGRLRDVVKRTFDIFVSIFMLVVMMPVMLLTALAVVIESRGPVLYTQERVGEGGSVFRIRKFRSMTQFAEKDGTPVWAAVNDVRVTRIGRVIRRTRIDELPQLFNVLIGEMSFVGPRPERPFFVEQLSAQIPYYSVRHCLKPGITGWSQVRYPYGATVADAEKKLQYDLYYAKNHSLFLDLLILAETLHVVLFGKGAR